jgi:hypothetical protein
MEPDIGAVDAPDLIPGNRHTPQQVGIDATLGIRMTCPVFGVHYIECDF